MNEKLKALYEKYKDLIPYVIFGVLTTIVNYVSYWLFAHPLGCGTVFSTAVAWALSVLFAYVTNRRWVFHSEARGVKAIGKEFAAFLGARSARLERYGDEARLERHRRYFELHFEQVLHL